MHDDRTSRVQRRTLGVVVVCHTVGTPTSRPRCAPCAAVLERPCIEHTAVKTTLAPCVRVHGLSLFNNCMWQKGCVLSARTAQYRL